MRDATIERRIRYLTQEVIDLGSAVDRLWAVLETAGLGTRVPAIGLSGAGPTSAAPPSSDEDDARKE